MLSAAFTLPDEHSRELALLMTGGAAIFWFSGASMRAVATGAYESCPSDTLVRPTHRVQPRRDQHPPQRSVPLQFAMSPAHGKGSEVRLQASGQRIGFVNESGQ